MSEVTEVWSETKGKMVPLAEMVDMHLLNKWRKMMRESAAGAGSPFPTVFEAIDAEVKRRGLDKPREEAS